MPLNLEGLVPDDDSVRLLSHELEDLDYSLLYQAYSAKGRNRRITVRLQDSGPDFWQTPVKICFTRWYAG